MRFAPIVGLSFALLIAGCSGTKPSSAGMQPPGATAPAASSTQTPSAPTASSTQTPSAPTASSTQTPSAPATAVTKSSGVALIASQGADKSATPAAKAPAAAAKAPVAQPAKKESAPPAGAKNASPTLDLTSLEQRLKDTSAIGVLTKIALKNQVDDLLDQFRAFYQGKLKTTLADLRRPYDLLVLKVLSLLQDSDPSLASAIVASREAIWGILADPKKFATVA